MDMNGWNSDFVEMVSLGTRLTLSSHSDCGDRRGSHMFQNRWTDGVHDALLKANGTAAVKDMNYALLASRPTMFGNEPHTQQTNWSMHTIWHIQILYNIIQYDTMIHMMIQVCERLSMCSSCSLFESSAISKDTKRSNRFHGHLPRIQIHIHCMSLVWCIYGCIFQQLPGLPYLGVTCSLCGRVLPPGSCLHSCPLCI